MFFHVLDLQKAAYKLQGRCIFQGLQISIENRRGSIRSGVDKDGHKWSTKMRHAYGYIRGVRREGSDGDKLDCFLGTHPDSEKVFILHLNRADNGKFDEDKVYLGFADKDEVKASFKLHYDKAGQMLFGGITELDMSTFKKRLNVQSRGMIKSQIGSDLQKAVLEIDRKKVKTTRLEDLEELLAHLAPGPSRDKVKAEYDRLCGKTEKSFHIIDIDLEKAHVKAHFRRNPATGKLEFIEDYDDSRHAHEVEATFSRGDIVRVNNPKSKHHGKKAVIGSYSSKYNELRADIEGQSHQLQIPVHHVVHVGKGVEQDGDEKGTFGDKRPGFPGDSEEPSNSRGNQGSGEGRPGPSGECENERQGAEEPLEDLSVEDLLKLIHDTGLKSPECTVSLDPGVKQSLTLELHQVIGAEQALTAFKNGLDGFLLGDGTGQGKTYTASAVIAHMTAHGALSHALVIVPNDGVRRQWMEVLSKAGIQAEPASKTDMDYSSHDGVLIATYNTFSENLTLNEVSRDLVVFDEAHKMKNLMGKVAARAKSGEALIDKQIKDGKKVLYLTATPYERPWQAKIYKALGLWPDFNGWLEDIGVKVTKAVLRGEKGMKPFTITDETKVFKGIFTSYIKAITSGAMLARDTPIVGVALHNSFKQVALPQEMSVVYHRIMDFLNRAQSSAKGFDKGQISGQKMFWSRQFLETAKIPEAIRIARSELSAGRQCAIMVGYKKKAQTLARLRKMRPLFVRSGIPREEINQFYDTVKQGAARIEGSLKQIKKAFGKDVVEYHGDFSDLNKEANKQAYNVGQAKVIVATQDAADTGLSLHDTVGNMPRTQINVTIPWTAMNLRQLAGRSYRLKTKSDVNQYWLFSDVSDEKTRADMVGYKLRLLGASVKGIDVQKDDEFYRNLFKFHTGIGLDDQGGEVRKSFFHIIDLVRSHVKAHTSYSKNGKLEYVRDHEDSRQIRDVSEIQVRTSNNERWATFTISDSSGKKIGELEISRETHGREHDPDYQVREIKVREDYRRQGLGKALYKKAFAFALSKGRGIHSDLAVSDLADHAWQSLQNAGFPVVKDPRACLDKVDNKWRVYSEEKYGDRIYKQRVNDPVWRYGHGQSSGPDKDKQGLYTQKSFFHIIDLEKSHVKAHIEHRNGKLVYINEYEDRHQRKVEPTQNVLPAFLDYKNVDDLRKVFDREYVNAEIKDPQGNRITFNSYNFNHITKLDTGKADEYRCKRMLWIKDVIQNPDLIVKDGRDPDARLYMKWYKGESYLFVCRVKGGQFNSVTAYPLESKAKLTALLHQSRLYEREGFVAPVRKSFYIIDLEKSHVQAHASHSRTGMLEYVSDFDRAQNFPAAATLTEDSPVCGQTLGNFLEDVLSGANVSSFLQRATSELGVQQFEDWFNPAKIGARIYKRLRDDGKSHSVARKTAADAIRAYSAAFKSAIGLVVPVAA